MNEVLLLEKLNENCELVGDFHEDLVRVRLEGDWFHVDRCGKPVYEGRFDAVGDFDDEGMAWVLFNGEWFHIFKDGTPAYEQRFDFVSDFDGEGLAEAKMLIGDHRSSFIIRRDGSRVN